jgi:multicomponent Na+:H+ antiporter subunit F
MSDFLLVGAGLVLATLGLGLGLILRGPHDVDRMMAAQLFGTGGVAVLVLIGTAIKIPGTVDIALTLALLTAFASIAFVKSWSSPDADNPDDPIEKSK